MKDSLPSFLKCHSQWYLVFNPLSFSVAFFLSCGVVVKHCQQTLLFYVLVFGVGIVGEGVDADAPAGGEDARYLEVLRVHQFDQVFHDDVDTIFVEIAVVAEREEVEFERLRLYHLLPWNVGDIDSSEVGVPCLWTE